MEDNKHDFSDIDKNFEAAKLLIERLKEQFGSGISGEISNQKTQIQSMNQKIEFLQNELENKELKINEELSKLKSDNSRIKIEYNDAIQRLNQTLKEKLELEVLLENKSKEILDCQSKTNLIDDSTLTLTNKNEKLKKELETLILENNLYKQNIETEIQVRTKIEGGLQNFIAQLQAMFP